MAKRMTIAVEDGTHVNSRAPWRARKSIVVWALFWLALIGSSGALSNFQEIRDARLRSELAERGTRAIGIIAGRENSLYKKRGGRCGRFSHVIVEFTAPDGNLYRDCFEYENTPEVYRAFYFRHPTADGKVGVSYEPTNPSRFLIAEPDWSIDQRDLNGMWWRWTIQSAILSVIYIPVCALFIWRKGRTAKL